MICRQCVFSPNTFLPRSLDSSSKSLERNKWTYPDLIMLRQQSSQMVEWNLTAPDLRRYITLLEIFFLFWKHSWRLNSAWDQRGPWIFSSVFYYGEAPRKNSSKRKRLTLLPRSYNLIASGARFRRYWEGLSQVVEGSGSTGSFWKGWQWASEGSEGSAVWRVPLRFWLQSKVSWQVLKRFGRFQPLFGKSRRIWIVSSVLKDLKGSGRFRSGLEVLKASAGIWKVGILMPPMPPRCWCRSWFWPVPIWRPSIGMAPGHKGVRYSWNEETSGI